MSVANTNSRQEEEQPTAKEGREEWTVKKRERKTMEVKERRALEEGRKDAPGSAVESEPRDEAQRGRVTHPSPKIHEGSDNGLNTNNNEGK